MAITHLIVDNGNYSVTVPNKVVKNLYDLVKALYAAVPNHTADDCYIRGTIIVEHAHPSRVAFLEEEFEDLHITMTGDAYLDNSDPTTLDKLATLGDGIGLTIAMASTKTSMLSAFEQTTTLVDASFFQYFTGLLNEERSTQRTFYGCTNLETVVLPSTLPRIGPNMFTGCANLLSIVIPNSVTIIGGGAFQSCISLTSVTIPNSVTSIGYAAFAASGLTSIVIPDSITSIQYETFRVCTGLTSVSIPNSVTSIGSQAFDGCSGLTNVTIGSSVTSIGTYAFRGCSSLTSVTIPASVTTIGNYAFNGCSNLTSVTAMMETSVSITANVFSNRANATLYVPYGCAAAYQAAPYWNNFKQIIELPESSSSE